LNALFIPTRFYALPDGNSIGKSPGSRRRRQRIIKNSRLRFQRRLFLLVMRTFTPSPTALQNDEAHHIFFLPLRLI
jgi:hypothetical protein